MTSFVDLAGATGADAPFTETVATALDRNLFAAMEGDSTAIAAGVRLTTTALADDCVAARKLSGGSATLSSSTVFDYSRISGSRTFNSSTNDITTVGSFIQKSGTYRIKIVAQTLATSGSSSLSCGLYINNILVSQTANTSGIDTQELDAVYTISANSTVQIKSIRVAGSTATLVNQNCTMTIYTDEIFNKSQRQTGWGYSYGLGRKTIISFRTT